MNIDIAILASPRVAHWPSPGVRWMTAAFAEQGLSVAQVGGAGLRARGVLTSPHPGGVVVAEDTQRRVFRIQARAVIRVLPPTRWGMPFDGSWSECNLPYETAVTLLEKDIHIWSPAVVILGTGNEAFRLGQRLLTERRAEEVFCLERFPDLWGGKRYAGWEVERRRFEMAGGKCIEGEPVSLKPKGAQRWELRIQDRLGIRPIEIGRLIGVGPFENEVGWAEYPPGSLRFGFRQAAHASESEHVEGVQLEMRAAHAVLQRVVRTLGRAANAKASSVKRVGNEIDFQAHRETPYMPQYRGKLLDSAELERLRVFPGVPKNIQRSMPVASLECFESIACDLCQKACPTQAIDIKRTGEGTDTFFIEDKCIGCGQCVQACPSQAVVMVREKKESNHTSLFLSAPAADAPALGESVTLLNRRGEPLGTARVARGTDPAQASTFEIDVPNHLIWDARGIRRARKPSAVTDDWNPAWSPEVQTPANRDARIECVIDGQKRFCRGGNSVSETLFELGLARSGDAMLCPDGSCGLCAISIDGVKRLGCQTAAHQGMSIQRDETPAVTAPDCVCPCLGLCTEDLVNRIQSGHLSSIEAVLQQTAVCSGTCHGSRCMGHVRQLVESQGIEAKSFVDWSFPFADWTMVP